MRILERTVNRTVNCVSLGGDIFLEKINCTQLYVYSGRSKLNKCLDGIAN